LIFLLEASIEPCIKESIIACFQAFSRLLNGFDVTKEQWKMLTNYLADDTLSISTKYTALLLNLRKSTTSTSSKITDSEENDLLWCKNVYKQLNPRYMSLVCVYLGLASKEVLLQEDYYEVDAAFFKTSDWLESAFIPFLQSTSTTIASYQQLRNILRSKRKLLKWLLWNVAGSWVLLGLKSPLGNTKQVKLDFFYKNIVLLTLF
jgi:hypothetical protein